MDKSENLYEYLCFFHPVSREDFEALISKFKERKCGKGEMLLVPGDIQRVVYFVREGVQMSFFDGDKKEHVMAFTYAPNLCAIPESFFFQSPSKYFLTCLTPSVLDYLTYDEVQSLYDTHRDLERLFRKMTEAVLAGVINRHMELHTLSMEERFRVFCSRSPQLLHMVSHKHMASYLHIDPTNFSKLYNSIKL